MGISQWVKLIWQGEEKNLKNKMPRKTDAEVLEELEVARRDLAKAKKELAKEKGEEEEEEYSAEPYDSDDEVPDIEPAKKKQPPVQVVEREISLSLLNDKLNFIISKVQNLK